jgi:cation transport regulator ChaC
MEPIWYFAYGSNLCRAIFVERRGMLPLATRWGWLEGHRLCFNIPIGPGERGVANLGADAAARTCGALYLLKPEEFDRLDGTELVDRGLYRRVAVEVLAEGSERVAAFTYVSSVDVAGRKPSPRYLGLLLDGARELGLPEEWRAYLDGLERAHDERESVAS